MGDCVDSGDISTDEVVVVFHSVNSRELRDEWAVVVFHSVDSGGLRNGWSRGRVPLW